MQNVLQARYGKRLPENLVIKKTKEMRNIQDLGYSLELLKLEMMDGTTVFIVHAFNFKIGCSVEYSKMEDALELWNLILLYRLHISEWYLNAKNETEKVIGSSIYSQTTGSWFDHGKKIDAFEPTLITVL